MFVLVYHVTFPTHIDNLVFSPQKTTLTFSEITWSLSFRFLYGYSTLLSLGECHCLLP